MTCSRRTKFINHKQEVNMNPRNILADVENDIQQVDLYEFPTIEIQRELSKSGYF